MGIHIGPASHWVEDRSGGGGGGGGDTLGQHHTG